MSGGELFPRTAPRSSVSRAEVAIWQALQRALPAGWRAWHSLRLRDGNAWEGEGDFVIASPDRGLLVLEVKGGNIELRDGRWYQNGRALHRAPRDQGLGFVRHLVSVLRTRGAEPPAFGVACAFPDVDFSDELAPGGGDLRGLVIGRRQLQWLEHVLPTLLDRALPDHGAPRSRMWLAVLHQLWGETWVPALTLADQTKDGEARVVSLVDEQLQLLAAAEDNPRAVVTGGAGTGKTLLARELCSRAAARGRRVLYLCFTDALGQAVERSFEAHRREGARLRAAPIRRFAAMLLEAAGVQVGAEDRAFWDTASLTAACDALPPASDRPELVVVDEAQDLEQSDWDLVSELVGDRGLWILTDERQAFWKRPGIPAALTEGAVRLRLRTQQRCPTPIAAFAEGYVSTTPCAADLTNAVQLVHTDGDDELARVTAQVTELLRAGARPQDIAIVTLAGRGVSQLLRTERLAGQRLVRADAPEATEHVIADTFLRFKGLERPFVLLVELAAGHASQYERRMHIAATRATTRLVVLASEDDIAKDPKLASLPA